MLPSDLAGVTQALQDINVDPVTIEEITRELTNYADTATEDVTVMPAGPLQGTDGGATFAYHTDLAREHLAKALQDMATAVNGYTSIMRDYNDVQQDIDNDVSLQGHRLLGRVRATELCADGPDQGTSSMCVPSDATGEDD